MSSSFPHPVVLLRFTVQLFTTLITKYFILYITLIFAIPHILADADATDSAIDAPSFLI
jgi:hypothetical protein